MLDLGLDRWTSTASASLMAGASFESLAPVVKKNHFFHIFSRFFFASHFSSFLLIFLAGCRRDEAAPF